MKDLPAPPAIIAAVAAWVERVVIGLNLCPFAKMPVHAGTLRYEVTLADDVHALLESLGAELQHLDAYPEVETTLLIHPCVLQDFHDYNAFLMLAEQLLRDTDREGVYQIASFHPDYQFAGTRSADAENYSNRSPYPMLHLLREQSVSVAVENHPDVEDIPRRNIQVLNDVGRDHLAATLRECLTADSHNANDR